MKLKEFTDKFKEYIKKDEPIIKGGVDGGSCQGGSDESWSKGVEYEGVKHLEKELDNILIQLGLEEKNILFVL